GGRLLLLRARRRLPGRLLVLRPGLRLRFRLDVDRDRSLERQHLGLLRAVRVVRPAVDLELAAERAAERSLREHAVDGLLDRAFRVRLEETAVRDLDESARVPRVAAELLGVELVPRELHLAGVDHDD